MTWRRAKEYSPAQAVVSVMTRPDQDPDPIKTTERGMLFSGPLVRAILDGRKTETRRPVTKSSSRMVKATRDAWDDLDFGGSETHRLRNDAEQGLLVKCDGSTHGVASQIRAGHLIYVRETHAVVWNEADPCRCEPTGSWCPEHMTIEYRADTGADAPAGWDGVDPEDRLLTWTPSIHMQRDRSRINLHVTEVCAERVQDIDWKGARAEGIGTGREGYRDHPWLVDEFYLLWDSIYSTRRGLAWGENPWVWRIKFAVEVKP